MNKIWHGLLLHKAVEDNELDILNKLLEMSSVGVNIQNEYGETPLLRCLGYKRSRLFIQQLLLSGADISIVNKYGIAPLSLCLATDLDTTQLILEYGADMYFQNTSTFSRKLYEAIKSKNWQFRTFVMTGGKNTGKVLVCTVGPNLLYMDNIIDIRDLNVFLNQIWLDENLRKKVFNHVCVILITNSLKSSSVIFKIIWQRVDYLYIHILQPSFLYSFIVHCEFSNTEFIECLNLILTSSHVSSFIDRYSCPFNTTFLYELLRQFKERSIEQHYRIPIILRCVQLVEVNIHEIILAYTQFGFNEDVVILISSFEPTNSIRYYYRTMIGFILFLEDDSIFSIDNLYKLELIPRQSYRKLINILPDSILDSNEILKKKKEILNTIPSLFQISKYKLEIHLQKSCKIKNQNQFKQIVKSLVLPTSIKNSLCYQVPMDFEESLY